LRSSGYDARDPFPEMAMPEGAPNESSPVIEDLVARCIERVESEGDPRVAEVCAERPELVSAVERRLAMLAKIGLLSESKSPRGDRVPPRDFPDVLGDFKLMERIGGGGMGVVYRAMQLSLSRDVALKLIRPEHLYFGGAHERFRREVEAVARLAHPGIVPIYTVGEEKGIPFFAMERVEGKSLSELLEPLKGRDPSKLTGRDMAFAILGHDGPDLEVLAERLGPTWIQAALRIAQQVAEALAHAHERGVVHRDIKPSNILVTRDGRAVLLDFGLAALRGANKLTKTGSALGSPQYMAPEVYASGGDVADPRTDVYSLGVTLYELLALQVPFGGDSEELMARILSGEFVALRHLNPLVSWDVETVCIKAMDVDAERRYPTPEAFAADLLAVLELRPISAARPSLLLRTQRFVQRRPGSAMAVVLAIFITVLFPLGYSIAMRQKNIEIEQQRGEIVRQRNDAERQREVAESHRNATLLAIDSMVASLADSSLSDVPGITVLRKRVLEQAESVVEQLSTTEREQHDVRRRLLSIRAGLGGLHAALGDNETALTQARLVEAGIVELFGAEPEDPLLRRELALARRLAADAEFALGRFDDAAGSIALALADLAALTAARPDDPEVATLQLVTLTLAGTIAGDRGLTDEQQALEASTEQRVLAALARWPDDPTFVLILLERLTSTALLAAYRGESDVARERVAEAEERLHKLDAKVVDSTAELAPLARIRSNLAEIHELFEDYEASVAELEGAVAAARTLVTRYPERPTYRHLLGRCLTQAAENRNFIVYPSEAERERAYRRSLDEFEESIEIFRGLEGSGVVDGAIGNDLGAALGSYGDWLANGGQIASAEDAYRQSIECLGRLLERNPAIGVNRDNLAVTYTEFGRLLVGAERPSEALEPLDLGYELIRGSEQLGLLAAERLSERVALNRGIASDALIALDRFDDAFAALAQCRGGALSPRDAQYVARKFAALVPVAAAPGEAAAPDLAERCAAEVVSLLDGLIANGTPVERLVPDPAFDPIASTPSFTAWLARRAGGGD
jgi:serine/threonine protein kinase/tetratricopeptide (TPR) repeat protein